MSKIIYPGLSYAIIGAAMEVHQKLGPGFLEKVYQNALAYELSLRNITFKQYSKLGIIYKNTIVGDYETDLIVEEKIIIEIKASLSLHPKHKAQVINYLTATGHKLALLMNFGEDSFKYQRVVNSRVIRAESGRNR